MKRSLLSLFAIGVAAWGTGLGVARGAEACASSTQASAPDGFTPLFNGKDLSGWWGATTEDPRAWMALSADELAAKKAASQSDIHQHWHAEGGVLVNDVQGLFLTTDKNYGDFELVLEYKTVAGADSGVYLRGIPQVQMWDTTEAGGKWDLGADKGSGGLWNNAEGTPGRDPLVKADKPFGEWNKLRVVMIGERVSVWLNGKMTVDHARLENYFNHAKPVPRAGPIQLQTHGGEIQWRDIAIREIEPTEANAILRNGGLSGIDHRGDGFAPVFNGKDFTGWSGPIENYQIVDGAVQCRPGHGGTIYTDEVYRNFKVRLDIRIPPGCNNGLAIRYPGEGDTAYVGMCELQVLDNTAPQYAGLDPRQFHGSVYAQVPAVRGYLRTPGEWNYQEVTVNGSRITVELNGTVILDSDISQVHEFMYPAESFVGRNRTEGHFGFAGHNDPVAYRNIEIKRLPD